jgi:tetratricopeptide (TPR) repeat protein
LGKHQEAIECFDIATKLDGNFLYAWYTKGYTLLDPLQKYQESIRCFEKAIKIHAMSTKVEDVSLGLWNIYNSKGVAHLKLKQYTESNYCFDKAISLKPDFSDAWYNKGHVLDLLGKEDEAKKCFDEARKFSRVDSKIHYDKASTILGSGLKKVASVLWNQKLKVNLDTESFKMELSFSAPKSLPMPFKTPLQSFLMPLKYSLYAGRMPLKYIRMPVKYSP